MNDKYPFSVEKHILIKLGWIFWTELFMSENSKIMLKAVDCLKIGTVTVIK